MKVRGKQKVTGITLLDELYVSSKKVITGKHEIKFEDFSFQIVFLTSAHFAFSPSSLIR